MAAKRLNRIDISEGLKNRLTRHGITTCADVLKRSQLELMKLTGFCGLTIQDLYHKCCVAQSVMPVTALQLVKSRRGHFLSTSLPDLDKVLRGGIPTATITEIAGPPGSGKTQFCMTLSVLATLPSEVKGQARGVLYIDTEGAFSAQRLLEIGQSRLPHMFSNDETLKQLATQVHIVNVQTCKALMARLQSLEEDIISKKIRLVILDSVASLVRKEYSSFHKGMIHRTDFLASEAALLKYIAETFNIPVVVTNQITTRFGQQPPATPGLGEDVAGQAVEVDGEGSYMTAALGNTWSHSVNSRLILQYLPGDRRQILVAKSPIAPFTCFDFFISEKGVEQDVQGQGHYQGTDPSKQAIQGREPLNIRSTQW